MPVNSVCGCGLRMAPHFAKTEQIALDVLQLIKRQGWGRKCRHHARLRRHDPVELSDQRRLSMVARSGGGDFARVAQAGQRHVDIERLEGGIAARISPQKMPDAALSFEPADIVNEVMSFGSPTPIDISVSGYDVAESRKFAERSYETA